ncbi:MAG: COG4315 family predicted lipoprotein, partial [Acidimicrobiia bacterium]
MKRSTLALLTAALLVIAACGTDGEEGTSETTVGDTGATTTSAVVEEETTTTAAAAEETTTPATEPMAEGVHTAETDLGSVLVDAEGFTLYIFTNDTGGTSSCNEGCIENWPAVPGDTAVGADLDAALFGTTARDDGTEQLTVNGMPLYRYVPDEAPGDVNGQGVGGVWFVVGADGNMIE